MVAPRDIVRQEERHALATASGVISVKGVGVQKGRTLRASHIIQLRIRTRCMQVGSFLLQFYAYND